MSSYDKTTFATVTAYISVLDSSGQPVRGLTQQDFAVAEDGWPVDIGGFVGGGHQPVTAVMLIDRSGSMDEDGKMADARAAALTFLDHLEDGRDRLGVIVFDDEVDHLQSLQTMNGSLRAHLRSEIGSLRPDGSTAYYDAIYQAVGMLRGTAGRKVVLALTDGMDNSSVHSWSEIVRYAQDNNVAIYTIGLGTDVERGALRQMAQQTGGQYYEEPSSSELASLYAALAQGLQDEYSLTYTSPTPELDGTTRQLEVTVRLPAGTVTAIGSYAVSGTLTPSLNLWPCLGILPVLVLLALPGLYDRVRGRGRFARSEPPPPPSVYPRPESVPHIRPSTGTALIGAPSTCAGCGSMLRPGARFCPTCGQSAPVASPPQAACPRCGSPLRPSAKFCPACAQITSSSSPSYARCPRCHAPLKPNARFCGHCGQQNRP